MAEAPNKLVYVKDDGQIAEILLRPCVRSLKWRKSTRALIAEHYKTGVTLDEKYGGKNGKVEGKEQVLEYREAVADFSARIAVEVFVAGLDTRNNTTEEKELLASEYDGPFWSNLDFKQVEDGADFFRSQV